MEAVEYYIYHVRGSSQRHFVPIQIKRIKEVKKAFQQRG